MPQAGSNIGVPPLDASKTMSGLDFLQAHCRRSPAGAADYASTLGFDPPRCPRASPCSPCPGVPALQSDGSVHGGVAATLLDSCMSCAVQTTMEARLAYTTLEIKVNMVRPITDKTGPVRAEGRSLYTGRRSATAEGKILDAAGTLLAHGTTTCIVFPL